MDNIIKNPTFIAFIFAVIAYSYIVWKKNNNKKNKKKNKKSDNNEILVAGIVFAITWLLSYGYLNYSNDNNNQLNNQLNNPEQIQLNQMNQMNQMNQLNTNIPQQNVPTYKLVRDISESPKSFTLMKQNGGITMPLAQTQIPDVFIGNF